MPDLPPGVRELLTEFETHIERERIEDMIGLTVCIEWVEGGQRTVHLVGFWPPEGLADAMQWASDHEADLNKGMPPSDDPFVVTVKPIERRLS